MSLIFLGLALLIPLPRLASRLSPNTRKNPRDGPRNSAGIDRLALASDIDLFATCLRAGLSTAAATHAVAQVVTDERTREHWETTAALLSIGVPTDRAWSDVIGIPGMGDIAELARMSHQAGTSMAQSCERIAAGLRTAAADDATARGERAGVLIALPLALCFLPAFILLGLAPVVISLGTQFLN
ncbi:Bacterial type II secretion system protein F domain protein [Corynebacterium atrinae]|uniref:type II secretion system F family protein n=1 Tax=Corynebacterium atrinae TaxID=1336740 RepID=UPI0025B5718E|nr:type II secretion system F family protein [Corynebacterium atrinae]WJY62368.1 Bacterial type II secretion system protein F domain protein [Corynebacterium atrinae]